jgi:hypothetical protein
MTTTSVFQMIVHSPSIPVYSYMCKLLLDQSATKLCSVPPRPSVCQFPMLYTCCSLHLRRVRSHSTSRINRNHHGSIRTGRSASRHSPLVLDLVDDDRVAHRGLPRRVLLALPADGIPLGGSGVVLPLHQTRVRVDPVAVLVHKAPAWGPIAVERAYQSRSGCGLGGNERTGA